MFICLSSCFPKSELIGVRGFFGTVREGVLDEGNSNPVGGLLDLGASNLVEVFGSSSWATAESEHNNERDIIKYLTMAKDVLYRITITAPNLHQYAKDEFLLCFH
jgi:hypothetical protein